MILLLAMTISSRIKIILIYCWVVVGGGGFFVFVFCFVCLVVYSMFCVVIYPLIFSYLFTHHDPSPALLIQKN